MEENMQINHLDSITLVNLANKENKLISNETLSEIQDIKEFICSVVSQKFIAKNNEKDM
jgi:hypothetical protein